MTSGRNTGDKRVREEAAQRDQQRRQQEQQQETGIRPSPPPYEVPETPLERLGPGFAYMLGIVGGAFVLNLLLLWWISLAAGA